MTERFLVIGAHGCIGAWAVAELVREGTPVVGFDVGTGPGRASLLLGREELEAVTFVRGDITQRDDLDRVLTEHEITHVLHLGALQLPYCQEDPVGGALVNVVGTVQVFDAIADHVGKVRGLTYASSIAVHGVSLYGAWKAANEGTAAAYWLDRQLPSIGLRPALVYGVGRDRGFTSSATKAMLAAALGRPFEIAHGGTYQIQHARDVARYFIRATRSAGHGAPVFETGGEWQSIHDVVAAIEAAVPAARGTISLADVSFADGEQFESTELEAAIGQIRWTPLYEGVAETIEHFRVLAAAGTVDASDLERPMP